MHRRVAGEQRQAGGEHESAGEEVHDDAQQQHGGDQRTEAHDDGDGVVLTRFRALTGGGHADSIRSG
jgi:hypothetical protein